jgi:hypothetical protein
MKLQVFGVSWMVLAIILVLLLGAVAGSATMGTSQAADDPDLRGEPTMAKNVLTETLTVPLNAATTAQVDIDMGDGNLTIDRLAGSEPVLASGTLQYLEKQGPPMQSLDTSSGQVKFTLRHEDAAQPWFRLPWAACNGATEWRIHLNPTVPTDLTAHSDGGNVKLDLAGMAVTRVMADTGGGNMEVVLPDNAANLEVAAKSGAGNVTIAIGSGLTGSSTVNANSGAGSVAVYLPSGVAAHIDAHSGMGKVIVDPQFSPIDGDSYQSPGYDSAANKIEITVSSGAGNVSVTSN